MSLGIAQNKELRLGSLAAIIIAILVANSWFIWKNFRYVSDQQDAIRNTSEIIEKLELLISAAKDGETGARGYLLTGQDNFLSPYRDGERDTLFNLNQLRTLLGESHASDLVVLEKMSEQRFEILKNLIQAYETSPRNKAKENESLIEGKIAMDALRTQVDYMKQKQREILVEKDLTNARTKKFFDWILILTTLLSTIVIVISFYQLIRSQLRIVEENRIRIQEAKEKEIIASLTQLLAGEVSAHQVGTLALRFLSDRFETLAGHVFISEGFRLRSVASMGVDNSESAESINFEDSLASSAMKTDDIWEIQNIPDSYWRISTSLGESIPTSLLFVPLTFQGKPLGILELASFSPLTPDDIEILKKLSEPIGIALNAAHSRDQLQDLLVKSQQQSEELQTQQEELKSSNEELEQQTRALESQQITLNFKNKELEDIQKDLLEHAEELKKSAQYKSDFLAKMSHELRTPLNGLLILSTLLLENKEGTLTPKQQDFAKSINSAGNDLLILINDILDLSKIEARKLSIRPMEFSLKSLVDSKKMTFQPQILAKDLEFSIELDPSIEKFLLFTDRQRLEQILRNFLSNAIKFTDKGKITLTTTLTPAKDRVTFSVTDSGIGIAKDQQENIFGAFEQGDGSISRRFGGTGLGLTISKELAALLGGSISLASDLGKGSTFSVTLPTTLPNATAIVESESNDIANLTIKPQGKISNKKIFATDLSDESFSEKAVELGRQALESINKNKKTILVVEDDDKFRSSICESVRSYGFEPIETGDGEVAIAILNNHVPDAILLDIKLPGISGLGILELIKQMPILRHVPVHMVSGLEYNHNALRMGALGYLSKPVSKEKIAAALDRIEHVITKNLRRVLLIEDDERQQKAISELISDDAIEVISVRTGKEAVSKLQEAPFDCIILDLTLPDVSGFQVLPELNKLNISIPPLVVYTGKELTEDEDSFLRKYSESIVIKGARSPERLLDEVNLFLHRVESLMPEEKRRMISTLRSQERLFDGRTVLIVDDDIRNVFALTSALESKGLQVVVARNGLEALNLLEQNEAIDIVLMDIMMPKMDGYEAIKRIRKNTDTRIQNLPIVALTAKAMREDHEKCIAAGASDYLSKPINLDNLITVLKVWISNKELL